MLYKFCNDDNDDDDAWETFLRTTWITQKNDKWLIKQLSLYIYCLVVRLYRHDMVDKIVFSNMWFRPRLIFCLCVSVWLFS